MRCIGHFVLALSMGLATLASMAADTKDSKVTDVGGKSLEQWIKDLNNLDPQIRESAVQTIVQFGKDAREAVPSIITKMNDPDAGVATSAIIALRTIGIDPKDAKDMKAAITTLTTKLDSGTTLGRMQSALALGDIGPEAKGAVKTLAEKTIKDNYSWELRKAAAFALGRVAQDKTSGPETRVVKALTDTLKDPCAQVRLQAIMSLGGLGAPRSPTDLQTEKHQLDLAIKNERDPVVRIWATVLQTQLEPTKVAANVAYLVSRLQKGTDAATRMNAAQALGTLGDKAKGNTSELIDALKDKEAVVSGAAGLSLVQLKDQLTDGQITTISKFLASKESGPSVRVQAATILGMLGTNAKSRIPDLLEAIRDKEPAVASAAASALGFQKDNLSPEQLASIAKLLTDPKQDMPTRCQAAQVLGICGAKAKAHVSDLMNVLGDKDNSVVATAILALASMGKDAEPAIPALTKLKQHSDESIKSAATQAIDVISGKKN